MLRGGPAGCPRVPAARAAHARRRSVSSGVPPHARRG